MAIKLTDDQIKIVESMVKLSQNFADQILHIMRNHGLDKVDGCFLNIAVAPELLFVTESVTYGIDGTDSGKITLTKGRRLENERFVPTGENSPEYEYLFADETVRSRMEKILQREKPLPPDGLWIGDPRNDSPVDSWEWDINDSLS